MEEKGQFIQQGYYMKSIELSFPLSSDMVNALYLDWRTWNLSQT